MCGNPFKKKKASGESAEEVAAKLQAQADAQAAALAKKQAEADAMRNGRRSTFSALTGAQGVTTQTVGVNSNKLT